MKKTFHISCCGRSGSKYVARALSSMGISVLHEMGDDWPFPQKLGIKYIAANPRLFANYDGLIGWKWSLLTPKYAAKKAVQFHLVREPVKAIESATTHLDSLFKFIESKLGEPDFIPEGADNAVIRLGRAVNYWLRYNRAFGREKILLRLEDFTSKGQSSTLFCEAIGANPAATKLIDNLPSNINARPAATRRVPASWERIEELFPSKLAELREMAAEYGYVPK
ncbi:hypothetical protein [Chelativorans sp. Marseille-P2723]|uniref:hypothetical protein n=1 Tax=Chelativorans sp. Marseille-P2723 TaxID=2709133 RepID=UPI00156ECE70|nr:hypothetical protein [Chelativorans sp. Marseille-P2723]